MNTLEMLDQLAEAWDVTLTSHALGPSSVEWQLVIRNDRAYKDERPFSHLYRGTLASVVARAWAGERGD